MPDANYVLLEKITVGATAVATVAFSGIPQTGYTDLVVKVSARTANSSALDALYIYFNTDTTAANYKLRLLYGTGTAANSYNASTYNDSTLWVTGNTATASTFSDSEFYIPNYTSATTKSVSYDGAGENNASQAFMGVTASSWTGTAAINKITIGSANGQNIMPYSTFYLYGVAALGTTPAIVPYATGGDTIMTDGTYWYHTFLSSGTFTPATGKTLSCDYLVVAGGGGGGNGGGGGGGAGGLRSTVTATGGGGSLESKLTLASGTGYTVTIGAGGAQGGTNLTGTNGSNSVFSTITSTGGGGGAGYNNIASSGGSGGGGTAGGVVSAPRYTGAAGTANQGYAGGNGNTGTSNAGGGGGGAGAVGNNATSVNAGTGGVGGTGVAVSISGSSVTYGGGGSGGSGGGTPNPASATPGGAGGGGAGGFGGSGTPTAGTPNTGGGGGADWNNVTTTIGSGGSGIVIVRYAV